MMLYGRIRKNAKGNKQNENKTAENMEKKRECRPQLHHNIFFSTFDSNSTKKKIRSRVTKKEISPLLLFWAWRGTHVKMTWYSLVKIIIKNGHSQQNASPSIERAIISLTCRRAISRWGGLQSVPGSANVARAGNWQISSTSNCVLDHDGREEMLVTGRQEVSFTYY